MAITGLPSLIIGVGGTGLRVLQRVKERLQETYFGDVPRNITLLELDTALQSPADHFCGVQLSQAGDIANNQLILQEMRLIQSTSQFTMHDVFQQARDKHARWSWMEHDKLARLLPPAAHTIVDGAGAFRPLGRTAFFLNYPQVEQWLRAAMQQVVAEQVAIDDTLLSGLANGLQARTKRNIFVVGSLAGGTGSGALLDVAALMRRIRETDNNFRDVVIIGLIALPRFFADTPGSDIGRRVPNTYAGLRELDRFLRAHKADTPYTMVVGNDQPVTMNNTLFDLCYLVDVQDYGGQQPGRGKAELGALPAMADMIVAHTDLRLGLRLNAANINVPALYASPLNQAYVASNGYSYQARRHYSAMNTHTVILPREDIARALSLRFLLDLIDTHTLALERRSAAPLPLVPHDPLPVDEVVRVLSKDTPTPQEISAVDLSPDGGTLDMGIFIRTLLAQSLRPDTRFSTDLPEVLRWLLEDGVQRKSVQQVIETSLRKATEPLPDKHSMPQYLSHARTWLETYLGPLVDDNNPLGDRSGGRWEQAFGNLLTEERVKMAARIQTLVLRLLNQRHEVDDGQSKTSLLRANRLGYALGVLRALKEQVRAFMRQTEQSFGETARNVITLRKDLEERRAQVTAFKGGLFARNPGPDYQRALHELAEAERQRLLRNLTLAMAQQFGGDIAQQGRSQSVLDVAIHELEGWVATLVKVRELIAQEQGRHTARRKDKYAIATRTYITDPDRFANAGQVEDGLYARYQAQVWRTLLGPDPSGGSGAGFYWEADPQQNTYFSYVITTKEKEFRLNPNRPDHVVRHAMLGKGSRAEGISAAWQAGAFDLLAEQVRGDRHARIAAYIPQLYANQAVFQERALLPYSKALVQLDGVQPESQREEHYLAVNMTSDDAAVNTFYGWFNQHWKGDKREFVQAESDVAATYLVLYHGLELDHIKGATDCEPAYRAMNAKEGCLHLFPEDRQAAEYESRITQLRTPAWDRVRRLDPEVAVCLSMPQRVRQFALALVSGLVRLAETDTTREYVLAVPGQEAIQLSNSGAIPNYETMGPHDRGNARLLQAFQTYMLRGRGILSEPNYATIPYEAVVPAFRRWLAEHHPELDGAALERLVESWKTGPERAGLPALLASEAQDPRFRDLGIVLLLELRAWRDNQQ